MCVYVSGLNPYLTLNTANSGTILIDLAVDDKEFQSVEEEVLQYYRTTTAATNDEDKILKILNQFILIFGNDIEVS